MELFEYIDTMNQPYDIFCKNSEASPLHWHYYSEILYIRNGSIRITCNGKEATLSKGDLCYFYPMQLHSVFLNPECTEIASHAVIKFNVQTLNIAKAYLQPIYDYFVHKSSEDDSCLIVHNNGNLQNIVENIVTEYENKEAMHMLAVQSGITSLLISIARSTDIKEKQTTTHSKQNPSFHHILEYIDTHSAEQIEVKELAKICNMSYSHFARIFRENYGRSCKEYIQYIRINKAQDLLLHSDFDLDYIAQETGFYDCSHFIRQYKKWCGITPKQERMKNKILLY